MTQTNHPAITSQHLQLSEQAFDLLLQGNGILSVRQYIAETHPDQNPDGVIAEAFQIFSHLAEEPQNVIRGFVLTNTKEIFKRNMEIGDFKAAQDCLKMMLKLSDSQPPPQVEDE